MSELDFLHTVEPEPEPRDPNLCSGGRLKNLGGYFWVVSDDVGYVRILLNGSTEAERWSDPVSITLETDE